MRSPVRYLGSDAEKSHTRAHRHHHAAAVICRRGFLALYCEATVPVTHKHIPVRTNKQIQDRPTDPAGPIPSHPAKMVTQPLQPESGFSRERSTRRRTIVVPAHRSFGEDRPCPIAAWVRTP